MPEVKYLYLCSYCNGTGFLDIPREDNLTRIPCKVCDEIGIIDLRKRFPEFFVVNKK